MATKKTSIPKTAGLSPEETTKISQKVCSIIHSGASALLEGRASEVADRIVDTIFNSKDTHSHSMVEQVADIKHALREAVFVLKELQQGSVVPPTRMDGVLETAYRQLPECKPAWAPPPTEQKEDPDFTYGEGSSDLPASYKGCVFAGVDENSHIWVAEITPYTCRKMLQHVLKSDHMMGCSNDGDALEEEIEAMIANTAATVPEMINLLMDGCPHGRSGDNVFDVVNLLKALTYNPLR